MAKMYTLDKKLLIGSPEIRIGDEVFPVDDREKNVKKIMKLFDAADKDDMDKADEAFRLAFGENYKKIAAMDMPFAAYLELQKLVIAALTGEDPDKPEKEETFPEEERS